MTLTFEEKIEGLGIRFKYNRNSFEDAANDYVSNSHITMVSKIGHMFVNSTTSRLVNKKGGFKFTEEFLDNGILSGFTHDEERLIRFVLNKSTIQLSSEEWELEISAHISKKRKTILNLIHKKEKRINNKKIEVIYNKLKEKKESEFYLSKIFSEEYLDNSPEPRNYDEQALASMFLDYAVSKIDSNQLFSLLKQEVLRLMPFLDVRMK